MAVQITRSLSEIDTKVKQLNKNLREGATESRALDTALKLDPENMQAISQKMQSLKTAVGQATQKVALLKQQQEEAARAFQSGEMTASEFQKIQVGVLNAENQLKSLNNEMTKTQEMSMNRTAAGFDKLAGRMERAQQVAQRLSRVAMGLAGSLLAAASAFVVLGDELYDTSQKFRVSVEELQLQRNIFEQVTDSAQNYDAALSSLNRMMAMISEGRGQRFYQTLDHDDSHHGNFTTAQAIDLRFTLPRRLPHFGVRGIRIHQRDNEGQLRYDDDGDPEYGEHEYPVDFSLTVFADPNIVSQTQFQIIISRMPGWQLLTAQGTGRNRLLRAQVIVEDNDNWEYNWQGLAFEEGIVGARLDIAKWSKVGVLPRITYFAGEMHEHFDGSSLQSIEVLEEKTGSLDSLSYGLSANYCKVSFLNRDRKFYNEQDFRQLRRNRTIKPRVRCGEGEMQLLGRFFSDEWQLDDNSAFMSCRAYDILYSLKDVIINFGMEFSSAPSTDGWIVRPFRSSASDLWTVTRLIDEVFQLINDERWKNGLFENIPYQIKLGQSANIVLPVVLIEKKSAWEVLQDIANLCCAHIYVDRTGTIVFDEDDWDRQTNISNPLIEMQARDVYSKADISGTHRNSDSAQSIEENGFSEHNLSAGLFVTLNNRDLPSAINVQAENILQKYSNGRAFVDAEWTGNPELGLGKYFRAHSRHEKLANIQKYECLSNEIKLNSRGFRQTTKGRLMSEGKRVLAVASGAPNLLSLNENNRSFNFRPPAPFSLFFGDRIASIHTGVELRVGQQYIIEFEYDTGFLLPVTFMVGAGAGTNQFSQIAAQSRAFWDRRVRLEFTPTEENLQNSKNLILRFDIGLFNVTQTTITITNSHSLHEMTPVMPPVNATITPKNAFNYNLPVLSRTAVNQVNYEYVMLENITGTSDATDEIRVRFRDCVIRPRANDEMQASPLINSAGQSIRGFSIVANVVLDRVWERIEGVGVGSIIGGGSNSIVRTHKIKSATASSLKVEFYATIDNFDRFNVAINP